MKKYGFTLIELIVSTSIIVMVTSIFLVNYSSANRRTDLTMTAQKLVSDIRLTQNYALGLARYGGRTGQVPLGGWGIHFDLTGENGNYLIFADENFSTIYDDGEGDSSKGGQLTELPENVFVESISFGDNSPRSKVDITFLPPDPITTIRDGETISTSTEVNIVLRDVRTETSKTVRVNFLGLAEVVE